MEKLILQPVLNACDFPHEVEMELASNDVNTHYQSDILYLSDWNDLLFFPETKTWLLETYGDVVKKYDKFGIIPT